VALARPSRRNRPDRLATRGRPAVVVRPAPEGEAALVAEVLADRSRGRGSATLDTAGTGAAGVYCAGQGEAESLLPVRSHIIKGSRLGCPPRRSAASC